LLEFNLDKRVPPFLPILPAGTSVHLGETDGSVPAPLVHLSLDLLVAVHGVLAQSVDVHAHHFMISYLEPSQRSLLDGNQEILDFLVVNLEHRNLHFIGEVGILVQRHPFKHLGARYGHYSLNKRATLLAPYPIMEYDFPDPVCP